MRRYVDVIIPLPLGGQFTYAIPENEMEYMCEGCRVVVPFGSRKYYTAIVTRVHTSCPEGFKVKNVEALLDDRPLLLPSQLKLWLWIADYYMCSPGDVLKAAMPSGLRLESETTVSLSDEEELQTDLSEKERLVYDVLLQKPVQKLTELSRQTGIKNILPLLKGMFDKKVISVQEKLQEGYKPKVEAFVRFKGCPTEKQLNLWLDLLRNAPKQQDMLMKYVQLSGYLRGGQPGQVSKQQLLKASGSSMSILRGLEKRQMLEVYEVEQGRLCGQNGEVQPLHDLSRAQTEALESIGQTFKEKDVCLLQGVTSSGKTEVYIHLIKEQLEKGRQVLYLLPEIALTTQLTERLRSVFGDRLGVYHSKFPDAERVEVWHKQLSDQPYDVILGVRSSIFLPYRNLGLIIVDEEHENTYKQQDPAPRYHARSCSVMLATQVGAKVLLGTATPSVETWFNAQTGKYGWVKLTERYQAIELPEIVPVDIKELQRKKRMSGPFSPELLQHIREALAEKEQVILFQNRRGYAPMIECMTCGWVPKCQNCDVSLSYHKETNQLVCHYCGYTYHIPKACPACGETHLRNRGFGTEKIEDDIQAIFPDAKVGRMDLDTTRSRTSYDKIISDFQEGRTQILIGTQMVSKGLDFDNVRIVGILNADTMLNYPDFRAYERAFQLMAQVSGRAGRKHKRGKVILQTKSIDHPIISQVMQNNYEQMVREQLVERQLFHYPPYYRLIYVYFKLKDDALLGELACIWAERLRQVFGNRVLGPDKPPVGRVQTWFIRKVILKIENNASLAQARKLLLAVQKEFEKDSRFNALTVYYDIDPQ